MIISLDKYKATGSGTGGNNTTETIIETGLAYNDGTVYNPAWEIQPADFFNGNRDNYVVYRAQYFINWNNITVVQPLKLTNTCIYSPNYKKQIWDNNSNEWRYIYNESGENIYDNDLSIYTHNLRVRDNDYYEIIEPHMLTYNTGGSEIWDSAVECDNILPPFYNYNDYNNFSDENVKKFFTKFYCTNKYYNLIDKYNNDTYITVGDQEIWNVQLKIDILPYITTNTTVYNLNNLADIGINIIGSGLTYYSSDYEILDDNKIYVPNLYFYDIPFNLEYVVPYVAGDYRKDSDIIYGKLNPYGQNSNIKNFINYRPDSNKIRLSFEGSYIGWKIIPTIPNTEITDLYFNDISKANCQSVDFGNCIYMRKTDVYDTTTGTSYEEISTSDVFSYCKKLKQIINLDTSNVVNMQGMFSDCSSLTSIPQLDTSKVTKMSSMFSNCTSLTSIPQLDTSKVTNMSSMFYGCSSLTSIPQLDTRNAKSMYAMFAGCTSLTSVPQLDASNVTDMEFIFANMYDTPLTDLGGFKNLSISVINGFIGSLRAITVESLMNIINNLATVSAETLSFGKANLDKLTLEQIGVATAKGWTLTA